MDEPPFDLRSFGCNSIYEFINKFIMPTTEITIINSKPDSFLIRSKQIYSNVSSVSGPNTSYHSGDGHDSGGSSLNHSSSQSSISSKGNATKNFQNQKRPNY
jgi:hypothetical protein